MKIYPAIDLIDNQCVRLEQGDFNKVTVYHDNPLEMALKFQTEGAKYIHLVDLDATINKPRQLKTIKRIIKNTKLKVQVGGGIRSFEQAETLIELGADKVIIGSMAIKDFDTFKALVLKYPSHIALGLDAKEGIIKTNGWQEASRISVDAFIKKLDKLPLSRIIYTDITKDGMLVGLNKNDYNRLNTRFKGEIIASGGVASLEDLKVVQELNLTGVIIGKALYEKKFTLKEALAC